MKKRVDKPKKSPKKTSNLTIIILSIAVVIFAIVFLIVFFSKTKISEDNIGGADMDIQIKNVWVDNNFVKVNLEIDPKNEKISGIKFIIETENGFEVFKEETFIGEFTKKEFSLNLTKINSLDIKKILVAPIFEDKENEPVVGSIKDTYSLKAENFYVQNYTPKTYYEYEGNHTIINYTQIQTQTEIVNQIPEKNTESNYECTDSDGGIDYYVKGNATSWSFDNGSESDKCYSGAMPNYTGKYLMEVFCANYPNYNIGNFKIFECPYLCKNGACINITNETIANQTEINQNSTNITNQTESNYTNQTNPPYCGNEILETGEFCDKTNLAGETCQSFGFDSGYLGCNKKCVFDTRYCYNNPETPSIPTCTSHSYSACDYSTGNIYWYDSCNNKQEMKEDCYSNEVCENGKCVMITPTCTAHKYSNCYNDNIYWYNSCGIREEIRFDCNSTQTCSNNVCVNQQQTNPPVNVPNPVFLATFEKGTLKADIGEEYYEERGGGVLSVVNNPYKTTDNPTDKVLKSSVAKGYSGAEYGSWRLPTNGKTYFYKWSMYIPEGYFNGISLSWMLHNQFETWPCEYFSNNYGDLICNNGAIFNDIRVQEDPVNLNNLQYRARAEPDCNLITMPRIEGKWVTFVIKSYWTNSNNGYHIIYENNQKIGEVTGIKTLFDNFPNDHSCDIYSVFGQYCDWSSSSKNNLVLYLDNIQIFDSGDGITLKDVCPECSG